MNFYILATLSLFLQRVSIRCMQVALYYSVLAMAIGKPVCLSVRHTVVLSERWKLGSQWSSLANSLRTLVFCEVICIRALVTEHPKRERQMSEVCKNAIFGRLYMKRN